MLTMGRAADVQKCMLVCQSVVKASDEGILVSMLIYPHSADPTRLFAWMVLGRTVDEFATLYQASLNGWEPSVVVNAAGGWDMSTHLKDCKSCSDGVIAGLTAIYEGRVVDVVRMLSVLSEEVLTLQETDPIVVGFSPFVD